jgi:protein-tyrosine phosphatase
MHYTKEMVREHLGKDDVTWYNISIFDLTKKDAKQLERLLERMFQEHLNKPDVV